MGSKQFKKIPVAAQEDIVLGLLSSRNGGAATFGPNHNLHEGENNASGNLRPASGPSTSDAQGQNISGVRGNVPVASDLSVSNTQGGGPAGGGSVGGDAAAIDFVGGSSAEGGITTGDANGRDHLGGDPEQGRLNHLRASQNQTQSQDHISVTVGVALVIACIVCILFGPNFRKNNLSQVFLGISFDTLDKVWIGCLVFWLFDFFFYVLVGEWSKLSGAKRQVHRLLCISMVVLSLVLKWIVPDQIQLEYAPLILTLLLEAAYHVVDLTDQGLRTLFLEWVPWLVDKLCGMLTAAWNKMTEWIGFNGDLAVHVGRQSRGLQS